MCCRSMTPWYRCFQNLAHAFSVKSRWPSTLTLFLSAVRLCWQIVPMSRAVYHSLVDHQSYSCQQRLPWHYILGITVGLSVVLTLIVCLSQTSALAEGISEMWLTTVAPGRSMISVGIQPSVHEGPRQLDTVHPSKLRPVIAGTTRSIPAGSNIPVQAPTMATAGDPVLPCTFAIVSVLLTALATLFAKGTWVAMANTSGGKCHAGPEDEAKGTTEAEGAQPTSQELRPSSDSTAVTEDREGGTLSRMPVPMGIAVILGAAVCKSLEPVLIAYSKTGGQYAYNYCSAMVMVEAVKFGVAAACVGLERVGTGRQRRPLAWSWSESRQYLASAVLLSVVNQTIGPALQYVDPSLYQITFNGVGVLTTGALTTSMLKQPLSSRQWAALALLILGLYFALPDPTSSRPGQGLALVLVTAMSATFSLCCILFDKTSGENAQTSVFWQSMQLAAYGVVVNLLVFGLSLFFIPLPSWNPLAGYDFRTWLGILGIVGADITMNLVLKFFSTMTYNFMRQFVVVATSLLSISMLGTQLHARFLFGAGVVMLSVLAYQLSGKQRPAVEAPKTSEITTLP